MPISPSDAAWKERFLRAYPNESGVIAAAFEGTHESKLHVHSGGARSVAFLINAGGDLYLAGDRSDDGAAESLREVLDRRGNYANRWIVAIPSDDEWAGWVDGALPGRASRIRRRYFDWTGLGTGSESIPPDLQIQLIDKPLAESASRELSDELFESWSTIDRFLAHGFGCVALAGESVVSICLSYSVGSGEAEIDIHTAKQHRRRGFGERVGSAFLRECVQRGLTPVWTCHESHTASITLAGKLGFLPSTAYWWMPIDMREQG